MSQVLGFVVQGAVAQYEAICRENDIAPRVRWTGDKVTGLRRYPWKHFVDYMSALTDHMRANGMEPLVFQRRMIPHLFRLLYSTRFSQRAVSPRSIIKMIDMFAGPFMFRCGVSSFSDLPGNRARMTITLHDDLEGSVAFFEHCAMGVVAQLELLGYTSSVIETMNISERSMDVTFALEDVVSARQPDASEYQSPLENILLWLADFEAGIIASDSEPSDSTLFEAIEHIYAATRPVESNQAKIQDMVTLISCRLQLAVARGWDSDEGCSERQRATELCYDLRALLRNPQA